VGSKNEQTKKQMKTITEFIYGASAILILAVDAVTANSGPLPTPRPRPTPYPRPTPPLTADIGSSYSNSKVPYSIDRNAILMALGYGSWPPQSPSGVAYGDFNGDGIPDVVFSPGPPLGPVIALGQPGGGYIDGTTQVISGEVPAPIDARKIIVADFNGDGWPDIYFADAADPPFPFNHNWLLLSDGTGHLVYQSALATIDPVGFHHGATAGDIDHSGHIDIFVTEGLDPSRLPYFLLNDGQGHFTVDFKRAPPSLVATALYTCELIDVDYDNNLDLVVGGAEFPYLYGGIPTEIFWGDGTGFYSDNNKTVLPGDAEFCAVLDIDSEDINHDGLRDLVITRILPDYNGFYFQVVMQTSRRVFADESLPRLIHDRSTWIGNNATAVDWIRLVDMTGDGAPDLVIDDPTPLQFWPNGLGWANDGNGYFTFTGGWLKVIWTTPLVGGTFSPPAPGTYSYDLNWDEAVDPASVQPTDLTLSGIQGATVTGVAVINDNFTTEFTLNIPTGGRLTASIAAGAITAQSGHPNVAFSGNYPVAPWASTPAPTPRPHPTRPPPP
jgi:hypothetical protein